MARETGRVTLRDIANATGVTVNTVSRALKNKEDISRETCLRIQKVAQEMGYVRNYIASSLRSGRTKTIALVAGSMMNPFYSILADLIQEEAVRLGYSLMILCTGERPEMEYRTVQMAISRQVDGILITPCSFESPALPLLRSSGVPFVLMSRFQEGLNDDCVICDDERGGYLAGQHLIEQGNRHLAMISFHNVVFSSRKRYEGFRRAALEAGIPEEHIHYAEPGEDQEVLRQLHDWQRQGVTGLFSFCDVEAWNALTLMENEETDERLHFSVVGFDFIHRYMRFPKPICTIDPHLEEEAKTAIDLVRRRIHAPDLPPQQIVLPVELICGDSCEDINLKENRAGG